MNNRDGEKLKISKQNMCLKKLINRIKLQKCTTFSNFTFFHLISSLFTPQHFFAYNKVYFESIFNA